MIENLFGQWFSSGIESIGSPELFALIIMFAFFFIFVFLGLEVDYALIMISPIPYAFYQSGYIQLWISALFMIIPLGTGIYMAWIKFTNR